MRALSQRTHEATGEIQNMIEALGDKTSAAVTQMDKCKILVEETMKTAQSVSESQATEEVQQLSENVNSAYHTAEQLQGLGTKVNRHLTRFHT